MPEHALGTPTPEEIAEDLQPVIEAAEAVVPADQVAGAKAFFKRYLKGEIALVGVLATLTLQYVSVDSIPGQIATGALGIATVVGIVWAKNGA
jgi:hypothetical protein